MFWLTILWGFLASIASRAVTTFGLENIFVVKNIDFLANYSSPWKGDDHSTKVSSVRKIKDALHRTKLLKIDPDRQMIRDQRDRWCRPPSAVCVVSYLMLVFEPHPEGSQAASSSSKVFRAWVIFFCDRLQRGDEQDHLIREQVQVAPEENGQNLLRIGGGQLTAAKLQPRSHLNIPCWLIICCDKGKDAILSVTFGS